MPSQNSGCFSGVLRRLFCSGDLPTHPSDANEEPHLLKPAGARAAEPGPGVVARLMGLSTLPDANWVPSPPAPGAVPRSKSVNFADYLLQFDSSPQAHHRRVRTSASFREVPTLNPHNDFLVLYMKDGFEPILKEPEARRFEEPKQGRELQSSNAKKKKTNNSRAAKRNESRISKLKNEPRREIGKNFPKKNRKCSSNNNYERKQSVPRKVGAASSKTEANKKIKKKHLRHVGTRPDPECDLENSSPISVLDVRTGGLDFSDEGSSPECENAGNRSEGLAAEVGRICRLAEEDIRGANWSMKNVWGFEALEELCMEVERHVVNVLLVQTLEDLV